MVSNSKDKKQTSKNMYEKLFTWLHTCESTHTSLHMHTNYLVKSAKLPSRGSCSVVASINCKVWSIYVIKGILMDFLKETLKPSMSAISHNILVLLLLTGTTNA